MQKVFHGKKKWYIWLITILLVIGGSVSLYLYKQSQPVDISKYISIKTRGYNKTGIAELSGPYEKQIKNIITDKKPDAKKKYLRDVTVSLNKTSGLSNGDKVTATVNTSIEDNPIKKSKKIFRVEKLSPIPKIKNLQEVLSNINSRVRLQFRGNQVYDWNVNRVKKTYFISGSMRATNTNAKTEKKDVPVSDKAFSILTLYHLKGNGEFTRGKEGYIVAGDSNISLENGEVKLSEITPAKHYWHVNQGTASLIVGFLDWIQTFGSEQEVLDWLQTNYPSAVEIE